MASVDATYAVVVFLAGSAVAGILGAYGFWFSLIGAAILLGLGAQTIYKALGASRASEQSSQTKNESTTPGKTYLTFAAATVVNPPTALYFLAITPSLVGLTGSDPVSATFTFASGVFIGSVVWQQALALAGAAIRGITTPRVRTWLSLAGGAMIIALAIVLAIRTLG
jgi:threonine/homoserine/homoserine lactone efflux protein